MSQSIPPPTIFCYRFNLIRVFTPLIKAFILGFLIAARPKEEKKARGGENKKVLIVSRRVINLSFAYVKYVKNLFKTLEKTFKGPY